MRNILVTGSRGFIGQNLIQKLQQNSQNTILEFTRENSLAELEKLVLQSDFIYHIAGEVRPKSSGAEFKSSNVTLTQNLVNILEKNGEKTPILLVSSIHARLQKNEYGKSKRESELLVEKYAKKHGAECFIYRLPHVFGEGCKANYNSVVSTWIYNTIKGLEVNVFDTSIEMQYVYVQDIVNDFISILEVGNRELYINPQNVYETTLGELVEYLGEFKNNIENGQYAIKNNEFKEKLFQTYKDYWRKINAK